MKTTIIADLTPTGGILNCWFFPNAELGKQIEMSWIEGRFGPSWCGFVSSPGGVTGGFLAGQILFWEAAGHQLIPWICWKPHPGWEKEKSDYPHKKERNGFCLLCCSMSQGGFSSLFYS